MRIPIFVLLVSSLTGCQVYNSGARDKLLYGGGIDPSSPFGQALTVIRERCTNCHAHFSGWSEADFIANGYVVEGSPEASQIYNRLAGANLGISAEDMPLDSVLTHGDREAIRSWIEGI